MTLFSSITGPTDIQFNAAVTPIVASPLAIDPTAGSNVFVFTANQNITINLSAVPPVGVYFFLITNDGILPRVITFGTNFKASTIITGLLGKVASICFISNGTLCYELARTIGL